MCAPTTAFDFNRLIFAPLNFNPTSLDARNDRAGGEEEGDKKKTCGECVIARDDAKTFSRNGRTDVYVTLC